MRDIRRLVVSIDDQTLAVMEGGTCRHVFPVSTAAKGMGFTKDSFRTPTGLFRICEKIGDGQVSGTIFKARVPVGLWQPGDSPDKDLVLTRILRLDGLESANANTLERCVYIHGTNRGDLIGKPAGHGCVRLRNDDMILLYDRVSTNDLVEIQPATRLRGALLFIMFDGVLIPQDGMMELARCRGPEILQQVSEIRAALRQERVSPASAWARCIDLIRPDREVCALAAAQCVASARPGVEQFMAAAADAGWLPVIISDAPDALVAPVARALGAEYCEAPVLSFDDDGSLADDTCGYRLTGGFDMAGVIDDWRRACLPAHVMLVGNRAPSAELAAAPDSHFELSALPVAGNLPDPADRIFSDTSTWGGLLNILQNKPRVS